MNQLIVLTPQELKSILDDFETRISTLINQLSPKDPPINDLLTPSEVSKLLNVSLQTIHSWSNQGILIKYKIKRKTRFKKEEVLSSLTKLEAKLNRGCKK